MAGRGSSQQCRSPLQRSASSKRSMTAGPNLSGKRHSPPAIPVPRYREITSSQHHQLQQLPDVLLRPLHQPLSGVQHGCIYCYARPSHAYLELSPVWISKPGCSPSSNAAELLRREFASRATSQQTIVLGANTDPYQPIEHRYRLTRALLEVMLAHRHPVGSSPRAP